MQWFQRNVFLVDGLGAVLSTSATAMILLRFHALFGMPTQTLRVLVVVAVGFAVYSLSCWMRRASLRPWLPIVMVANLAYCGLVAVALIGHGSVLTPLGLAYFIGEMMVILGVVLFEARVLRSSLRPR